MKRWGILIILIVCSALSGCTISHETDTPSDSKGVMTQNQVLTLAANHPLTTLDTDKLTQFGRLNNTIEGLYQANGDNNPQLALAKRVKVNAARTTYTFTLWKDSYWSNGDVITAPDFVFSWRRALAPTTKAPEADLFDGIQNARQILDGQLPASRLGVRAPSRFKLVVHLDHPMAELPQKLAYPLFGPQNQRIAQKYGKLYATKPRYQVYAGPFMVAAHGSTPYRWHMIPNPHYWDRKHVYLSRINVKTYRSLDAAWDAYDSGKLDEMRLLGKADTKYYEKKADYTARPYSKMVLLNYRQNGPNATINHLLQQKIARLAISHAINRKALVKTAYGNTSLAAQGVVPAGLSRGLKGTADFAAAQPEQTTLTYQPKTAQREWQTALRRAHTDRVTLMLSYLNGTNSGSAARTLRRQLESRLPGLTILLKKREQTINRLAAPVNSDLTLTTQRAQYADPLAMLSLFTSSNSANIGHWANQAYDDLIDEASNAPSFNSKRWQTLLSAEGMLMKDQGVTPLVQPASTYLVNPKLNGVLYNTVGTQSNFKSAYFVK
ncbi:MAG TPA: peptide ABC transporter substrate-binding protein [Levilactobacillus hammesii]|uniref:Peptide ABC transporter substrate-binding protein n=1 Tax=Levilactobacillus hammesii TaxID=267633 RepID=A0A921F0R5_9LACO|nr:peptide ABC transporter substrate-binding protein [Levilactobacillus hammesii]